MLAAKFTFAMAPPAVRDYCGEARIGATGINRHRAAKARTDGADALRIDGGMRGEDVYRNEVEFTPGPELTVAAALAAYRNRADATNAAVRSMALSDPCRRQAGTDLRWVLLHLINETARHAGHADATRELLDGTTGE